MSTDKVTGPGAVNADQITAAVEKSKPVPAASQPNKGAGK